jgi:hypothetical protein
MEKIVIIKCKPRIHPLLIILSKPSQFVKSPQGDNEQFDTTLPSVGRELAVNGRGS